MHCAYVGDWELFGHGEMGMAKVKVQYVESVNVLHYAV
jgi:hypothetical protein